VSNENPSKLPAGCALDLVDDPCVIVLRRGGGAIVARFTRNVGPQEFTPRELRAAYEDFIRSEAQYLDAETGIKATAYLFGAGVLLLCEEPETHVVMLIHPSTGLTNSEKSVCRILDKTT
jgi:hypothetical protein